MIKKIRIKNFQSHKNTELELSPGVNVIVGKSDAGKTSVYRAINWLVFNRPLGDAFRSTWSKKDEPTIVEITFENGLKVQRIKSNTINQYKLIDGKKEEIFEALGQSVPEKIQAVCNLEEINFSSQFDSPFLISKGSAEAGRYLNDIIGLDVIDQSLSYLNRMELKEKNAINLLEKQIAENQENLKKFEGLDELLQLFSKIEKLNQSIVEQKSKMQRLISLLEENDKIQKRIRSLKRIVELDNEVKEINNVAEKLKYRMNNFEQLKNLALEKKSIEKFIDERQNLLRKEEKTFKELMPDVCPLCGNLVKKRN